jgi:hypothetical protein
MTRTTLFLATTALVALGAAQAASAQAAQPGTPPPGQIGAGMNHDMGGAGMPHDMGGAGMPHDMAAAGSPQDMGGAAESAGPMDRGGDGQMACRDGHGMGGGHGWRHHGEAMDGGRRGPMAGDMPGPMGGPMRGPWGPPMAGGYGPGMAGPYGPYPYGAYGPYGPYMMPPMAGPMPGWNRGPMYGGMPEGMPEGMHGRMPEGMDGQTRRGMYGRMQGERDGRMRDRGPVATSGGQSAFAAIEQIASRLVADPHTDWSKVDLEALRQHLIDMDNVTLHAQVASEDVDGGAKFTVTSTDPAVTDSIRRMVLAHAMTMAGYQGLKFAADQTDGGEVLTVTGPNPAMIRGLGFIGILALGSHHDMHHMAMATGRNPHQGPQGN